MNLPFSSPAESILRHVENTSAHPTTADADKRTALSAADSTLPQDIATALLSLNESLSTAIEAATEYGIAIPDALTTEYVEFLAAHHAAASEQGQPSAIIMSPACGLLGLIVSRGFHAGALIPGHLTCIEPDVTHQQLAREAFTQAELKNSSFRFLPSHPLNVVGRLNNNSYDLAIVDCPVEEIALTVQATLPALRPGGVVLVLDSLMDGLISDEDTQDRDVLTARHGDELLRGLPGVRVSRLPLGAGVTILTKTLLVEDRAE